MRIGLVIYDSLETVSGGYLYDRRLVEGFRRQGDEVTILSLPGGAYARLLGQNFSERYYRQLRDLRADVLLQDELNHPSLFLLNRRLQGKVVYRTIAIVHHLRSSEDRPAWQNRFYAWIERRYLESVDGFIFNSLTTRQSAADLGVRLEGRPWTVAYPAGDRLGGPLEREEIMRRAYQPGPLRLVFLGNVIPRKGLHTLLEALLQVPPGCCSLEVVGSLGVDRPYARAMQRRAAQPALAGRVRFRGALPDGQAAAVLRESHVLAAPSSYEGFGIVYLEAMAYGLPAIGTTAGAAGEIITPGRDGDLVTPGDATALALHLLELAGDRERLADMGLAARDRFLAAPTWDKTAGRVRDFVRCALQ